MTGLTNGTTYSCSIKTNTAAGSSVASTSVSVTPVTAGASAHTPANFSTILSKSASLTLPTASTAFTSRGRYLLADASGNFLTIGTKTTDSYGVTATTLGSSPTYQDYLSKMVQVIVDNTDASCFRLDSHLHYNYSLDADTSTSTVYFRNNWGKSATSGYGYVCFSYDSTTKLLTAKKRSVYSVSDYSHTTPATFELSNKYLKYTSGVGFSLDSTGTPFTLYASPINFSMPFDFNPSSLAAATNNPVPYGSAYFKAEMNAASWRSLVSKLPSGYRNQVSVDGANATVGYNASTVAAQDAMLATISATATANGFSLRYPLSVYKAFRDAALRYTLKSDGVVDGTINANTVPLIYFTNGYTGTGSNKSYHPFMMVVSHSVPDMPHLLKDVIKPPGGGAASVTTCNNGLGSSETGYPNQCVTRSAAAQNFIFRVPLRDYGLTSKLCDNTEQISLYSDFYTSATVNGVATSVTGTFCNTAATAASTIENYSSVKENGVLVDGTSAYPVLNNVLITSQEETSLNPHGCHVGQGMGYHCHSDGFSAMNNDMSVYNISDYVGRTHPPLIGFGLDGVALFGRYMSGYTSMVGYTTSSTLPVENPTLPDANALDGYGGHSHLIDGVMVYHYHSRPYAAVTFKTNSIAGGVSYLVHSLFTGAWRGKINDIPDFYTGTQINTVGSTPSLTD